MVGDGEASLGRGHPGRFEIIARDVLLMTRVDKPALLRRLLEVDFAVRAGKRVVAIEVKSGRSPDALPGLDAFADAFIPTRTLVVGEDGIPLGDFLSRAAHDWLRR